MRHVTLTCKNHPNLRWHCKEIAATKTGAYNGLRHIFFEGHGAECPCPPSDLTFAPEELELQKTHPLGTE